MAPHAPLTYLLSEKKTLRCQLRSISYAAIQINNWLKTTSAIKEATMKITDDFCYEWKPSRAYHRIDTFCGEQRWMEGTGKSMKNVLCVWQYGKRHLLGWRDIEQQKIKLVALVWRHQAARQPDSWIVSQSVEILLNNFFNYVAPFWKCFGSIQRLSFT